MHARAIQFGLDVTMPPTDESWGVREFHLRHPMAIPSEWAATSTRNRKPFAAIPALTRLCERSRRSVRRPPHIRL
jgi:hypothetical protein